MIPFAYKAVFARARFCDRKCEPQGFRGGKVVEGEEKLSRHQNSVNRGVICWEYIG